MTSTQRSFVVIGLGTFGRTIATELARSGDYVLGIDIKEQEVGLIADTISEALILDARDEQALHEAGVGRYDVVVVAIGEDMEANILCTMNAKRLGVKTVWAKAVSGTHHQILTKLGADRVVQPEKEIGQHVAQMLHNPLVHDYLHLDDDLFVMQIKVPRSLEGKSISDLGLLETYELHSLGLLRGRDYVDGKDDRAQLEAHDKLLLLGRGSDLRTFGESL